MTEEAVPIIITIEVGHEKIKIKRDMVSIELEHQSKDFGQAIANQVFRLVLKIMDDTLQKAVPQSWKNTGRVKRRVVFENGYICFKRRIYRDEQGRIWKPLDLLLGVDPYARNSRRVQELGCLMVARSSYRNASEMLEYLLQVVVSPSSLQRMVKRFGVLIQEMESDWSKEGEAGKLQAPVLYGESDGVWLHLQQSQQKRAEVKVGLFYTGKKQIGVQRYACENKVVMTQVDGSNEEWQIKLRELADRHFDLSKTRCLVVGGDGATWVKHSFDLLKLPQVPVLDRFHLCRAVHRSFGKVTNAEALLNELFVRPFDEVKPFLLSLTRKTRAKQKQALYQTLKYLENNQDALLNLDLRQIPELANATLGSAEPNVDKLVRQRMRGRGCSWSISGAQGMLAILRHKQDLASIVFQQAKPSSRPTQERRISTPEPYQPYSTSMPVFRSADISQPWVQLLRNRLKYDLSLTALF